MIYNEWSGPLAGGGFSCHGCGAEFQSQFENVEHVDGCPGACVKAHCGWHMHHQEIIGPIPPVSLDADAEAEQAEKFLKEIFANNKKNIPTPEHLAEWLDSMLEECASVMRQRGKKYGPGNIAEWGELGVLVRLSDKMARLRTMQQSGVADFADESVEDTYIDIVNYAVIALAWRRGLWPGSEKNV